MSDRAPFRSRASASSSRGSRGGRNTSSHPHHGHSGHHQAGQAAQGAAAAQGGQQHSEKPKKDNILDLGKYLDREIRVKFSGGREVTGVLKGHDQLMNLVLDDVVEVLQDDEGNSSTRPLGLIVARGTLLVMISPKDGSEEIENPFVTGGG